ncbi:MAG TPA: hypothetical protein VFZ59_12715 [Verrucomicrobiae bacterium]|nr:hypothetical protein [Verrucomicrobiae bacterium]
MREAAVALDLELQLPEDPGFVSRPPLVSLAQVIKRSRQLRAWFPAGIRTPEERWRAKAPEEFKF